MNSRSLSNRSERRGARRNVRKGPACAILSRRVPAKFSSRPEHAATGMTRCWGTACDAWRGYELPRGRGDHGTSRHADAVHLLEVLLAQGDRVAITPQVLAEFVHIVTDARRFQRPLSVQTAIDKSERWWNAAESEQVLPSDVAVARFHSWMRLHQLGRKRVLDTLLGATYRAAGVTSLPTLNAADFAVFGEFACLPLAVPGP